MFLSKNPQKNPILYLLKQQDGLKNTKFVRISQTIAQALKNGTAAVIFNRLCDHRHNITKVMLQSEVLY